MMAEAGSTTPRMLNWIPFVQAYSKQHGLQYGQALAAAKPAYAAYREESMAKGLLKAAPMPRKTPLPPSQPVQTNKPQKLSKSTPMKAEKKKKKKKDVLPPILNGDKMSDDDDDDDDDDDVYERKVIYQKKAKAPKRKRETPSELEVAVAPIIGKKRKVSSKKKKRIEKAIGPQGAPLNSVYDIDLILNTSWTSPSHQQQQQEEAAAAAMTANSLNDDKYFYLTPDELFGDQPEFEEGKKSEYQLRWE